MQPSRALREGLSPPEEVVGLGQRNSSSKEKRRSAGLNKNRWLLLSCSRASHLHLSLLLTGFLLFHSFSSVASALKAPRSRGPTAALSTLHLSHNSRSRSSTLQQSGSSWFGGPPSPPFSTALLVHVPPVSCKRRAFSLCSVLSPSVSPLRNGSLTPSTQSLDAPASHLSPRASVHPQALPRSAVSAWLLQALTKRCSEGSHKAAETLGSSRGTPTAAAAAAAAAAAEALPGALSGALCHLKTRWSSDIGKAGGLWLRICTGVPLASVVVGLVLLSPLPVFAALGWAQSVLGLREFIHLCRRKHLNGPSLTFSAAAHVLLNAAAATGDSDTHLTAEAAAVCGQLLVSLLAPPSHKGIADVAVSLLGHLWGTFLPSFWTRLRALSLPFFPTPPPPILQQQEGPSSCSTEAGAPSPAHQHQRGFFSRVERCCMQAARASHQAVAKSLEAPWAPRFLVLYGLLLIGAHDSIAFLAGSFFGKTGISSLFPLVRGTALPPAALVSPRKTIVGLAAGAATASLLSGLLAAALGAAAATRAAKNARFLALHASRKGADEVTEPQTATAAAAAAHRGKASAFARQCILSFGEGGGPRRGNRSQRTMCLACLWGAGALVGLAVAAAAVAGDLLASLLKRDAGVKDSGALLPGHGGWIDRTDAHLLAGPLLFGVGRCLQRFLLQLQAAALELQGEGAATDALPQLDTFCWPSESRKEEVVDEQQRQQHEQGGQAGSW
ncbi:hypothetical protein Esti_001552 [Eimeria stiedai]